MLNSCPRRSAQLEGASVVQPWGRTTHVWVPAVDIKTRTSWAGVPTWIVKDDQGPSLPSLEVRLAEQMKDGNIHLPILAWGYDNRSGDCASGQN